ncbi:hypothetical protein [Streptomyces roseochromogenus]|uniref:Uncharacterized protein n=1 Tax=Streptomyces roseochromogenus subsp. oscitans DS 12.976 TaxID=1352936 RepID=V6JGK4_STRRC|nr:hypothetical protein [Streptomyces roseochromogenus]EST18985.1 hypothetical protein M878_42740 [Streptomyces roseochromogenus subsp. oscitans DS 12.976]
MRAAFWTNTERRPAWPRSRCHHSSGAQVLAYQKRLCADLQRGVPAAYRQIGRRGHGGYGVGDLQHGGVPAQ